MTNRLVAAGASRLKKAADAAINPAVPAELQKRAAEGGLPALTGSTEPSVFAGGRVLAAEDIKGTPEEQLAYITERLVEIDDLGRRAEDFVVLNKGALLEVAQERELHKVAGHTNFARWAGGVLDIEEKYVYELLQDAARIRAIGALGEDLAQHLTKASARKVVSEVIAEHGLETARAVITEGLANAGEQGKKRPTAAMLTQAVRGITAPAIPAQDARSEISDPPETLAPASPTALDQAAAALRERVHAALAPAAVKAALAADPVTARRQLEQLATELERTARRLTAAQRAATAHEGDLTEANSENGAS